MKNPNNSPSVVLAPAWHPDFRLTTNLPDIKPIRTMFYVNGAAVLIVILLLIYTGYRELRLRELNQDIDTALSVISQNKQGSSDAIALFGKFKDQEKGIVSLRQFLPQDKPVFSELVLHLGSSLPLGITLDSIDYRASGLVLRGGVKGDAGTASGIAYNYADFLRSDKDVARFFDGVTLSSVSRDAGSGLIRFEITLKVKSSGATTPTIKK